MFTHTNGEPGSPPRIRGKHNLIEKTSELVGITPAYTGKTNPDARFQLLPWDHPRVYGENSKKIPFYKGFFNWMPHISFSFKNTLYNVSQSGSALCRSQGIPKYSAKDPNL